MDKEMLHLLSLGLCWFIMGIAAGFALGVHNLIFEAVTAIILLGALSIGFFVKGNR